MGQIDKTNVELTRAEKIQLISTIGDWKEGEDSKFWTRYSIFLTINSGLLGALFIGNANFLDFVAFGYEFKLGRILVSLFGIVFCYFWYQLLLISKGYVSRWISDLDTLLKSDPELQKYVKGYSDTSSRLKPTKKSKKASDYGRGIVAGYTIIWSVSLLIGLLEGFGLIQAF